MKIDDKTPKYHLTFDIDWAPDFCVETILEKLDVFGVKGTFFVTHETDIIKEIEKKGHTVGLHPNFLPSSTQGSSTRQIIDFLLKIAPDATVLRTHSLVQSSPLLFEIFSNYKQLTLDLSMLMYRFPHVGRFNWSYEGVSFDRINYNWEDDKGFSDSQLNWSKAEFFSDVTILDFHPIHIALNSTDLSSYKRLKTSLEGKPLRNVSKQELQKFVNPESGAATYLDSVLSSQAQSISLEKVGPSS